MEREEIDDLVECYDCSAALEPAQAGVYVFGDDLALCWQCAQKRGGVYASEDDRWLVAPNIADLPDERRAHP